MVSFLKFPGALSLYFDHIALNMNKGSGHELMLSSKQQQHTTVIKPCLLV